MLYDEIIHGAFRSGKFVYQYPDWLFSWMRVEGSEAPVEKYEIYNPQNIPLEEGVEYRGRIISFEDGDIIEIMGVYVPSTEPEKPRVRYGQSCFIGV